MRLRVSIELEVEHISNKDDLIESGIDVDDLIENLSDIEGLIYKIDPCIGVYNKRIAVLDDIDPAEYMPQLQPVDAAARFYYLMQREDRMRVCPCQTKPNCSTCGFVAFHCDDCDHCDNHDPDNCLCCKNKI